MKTNLSAESLSTMLRKSHERNVAIRRRALERIDEMAMSVPNGFRWPPKMRRAYERAVKLLNR